MSSKTIERKLSSAFRWYGELVGHRPLPFFLVPLIVSLLMAPALFTMKSDDDDVIMLFTPYNAPSRIEQRITRQFSHTGPPDDSSSEFSLPMSPSTPYDDLWFAVQVTSRENLMTQRAWTLISEYVNYLDNNFTCRVDDWVESADTKSNITGTSPPYVLRYRDFCDPDRGCEQLGPTIDRLRSLMNKTKYGNNTKVRLTYPVMYLWNQPFNWGEYILGAKYDNVTGELESARLVQLFLKFQVNAADERLKRAAAACIRQLNTKTLNWHKEKPAVDDAGLTFLPVNEPYLTDEVARTKDYLPALLSGTVLLIFAFIACTSFQRRLPVISLVGAGMGELTVGVSLLASFSFLSLCGVHMNFVVSLTPYLVLCVGIDNDFLITSAWRHTADGHSSVKTRLGRTFADCGPSLTITSLNDILCFGIGYMSETPAIADFCLHTSIALLFRFIYQLTFFAAIVVYLGEWETKTDQQSKPCKNRCFSLFRIQPPVAEAEPLPKKIFPSALLNFTDFPHFDGLRSKSKKEHGGIRHFFGQQYTDFLMSKSLRVITCVVYVGYVLASVTGASKWIIDITPQKLFYDFSPLQKFFDNHDTMIQKEATIGHVYVTAPPDFRDRSNINRFFQFVAALERVGEGEDTKSGGDTTQLWLRQYTEFLQYLNPSDVSDSEQNDFQADFYDYLPQFLQSSEYNRFTNDFRFKRDPRNRSAPLELDKFHFTISYFRLPQRPYSYDDHVEILVRWRAVCNNYSDYQAVVYDGTQMNPYYDQRLTLAPACLQTMGIALVTVSVVTALLMPDGRSMFFICLSFLSVDVGVIAGLRLWRTDLDPTSVAFVLMTIGFSVYYTARVCYCYQRADSSLSCREKMRGTMEAVGWPILQGALATLVGVIPSFFLPCYMIRALYHTVILVVLIGLAHGLIIMPVIMVAFDRQSSPLNKFRRGPTQRHWCKGSESPPSADTLSECSSL